MIRLEVKDYCQNCPDFKADVNKTIFYIGANTRSDTVIRCKNSVRCDVIKEYIDSLNETKED